MTILHLRKIGIFKRLNIAFSIPLMVLTAITYFFYLQYAGEFNRALDRYTSLLVQNVELKISDIMQGYEDIAKNIYNDNRMITALIQNAQFADNASSVEQAQYTQNCTYIENRLYNTGYNQKYIVNIQLVTPFRQYHMISDSGTQRGYTIQNLDSFYESEFYLLPQENLGYPTWMDSRLQAKTFFICDLPLSVFLNPPSGITNTITLGIALYVPVTREFLGVLLMNIDLEGFSAAADGYKNFNDGNIFLIGKDGLLLSFYPSLSAPAFPAGQNFYEEFLTGKEAILRTSLNNQKLLVAYNQISSTEIYVVYLASLSTLLSDTYQIRNLYILILILVLIICFLISYSVTISIANPISQLISVMQETGDGKWEARYNNSGHDEITILGEQFNEMAEKLKSLVGQVYLAEIHRQKALLYQKNAQLDALLMQINPHFLYNTLDIIRWEAMFEAHGESNVTRMIEKFSSFYRMGMKIGSNTIKLSEGLKHAVTYLEIINFRHQDKILLQQEIACDPDMYYIPPFLLQPLIENTVVHGFKDGSKGFHISIQIFLEEQSLRILVKDNGKGIPPKELAHLEELLICEEMPEESFALVNVNQRIRLFYGNSYGIHIESVFLEGTTVAICLPVRTCSEKMEGRMPL